MPDIKKEGIYISDIVKYEAPMNYSRKLVTIPSGTGALKAGAILKLAENGYVAISQGDAPAAILLQDVDATSANVKALAVARHAIVVKQQLVCSIDDEAALSAVYDDLESIGIIVVEGV